MMSDEDDDDDNGSDEFCTYEGAASNAANKSALALAAVLHEAEDNNNALYNNTPSYYHCYCLRSLDTKHPYKNYVGFTTNPYRRLRQHNGILKHGGARYTKRGGRPWEFVIIIGGFPTHKMALQFEWAWQHPDRSLIVRANIGDDPAKKLKRKRGTSGQMTILKTLLVHCPELYDRNPLTLHFLKEQCKQTYEKSIAMPSSLMVDIVDPNIIDDHPPIPTTPIPTIKVITSLEDMPFYATRNQTKSRRKKKDKVQSTTTTSTTKSKSNKKSAATKKKSSSSKKEIQLATATATADNNNNNTNNNSNNNTTSTTMTKQQQQQKNVKSSSMGELYRRCCDFEFSDDSSSSSSEDDNNNKNGKARRRKAATKKAVYTISAVGAYGYAAGGSSSSGSGSGNINDDEDDMSILNSSMKDINISSFSSSSSSSDDNNDDDWGELLNNSSSSAEKSYNKKNRKKRTKGVLDCSSKNNCILEKRETISFKEVISIDDSNSCSSSTGNNGNDEISFSDDSSSTDGIIVTTPPIQKRKNTRPLRNDCLSDDSSSIEFMTTSAVTAINTMKDTGARKTVVSRCRTTLNNNSTRNDNSVDTTTTSPIERKKNATAIMTNVSRSLDNNNSNNNLSDDHSIDNYMTSPTNKENTVMTTIRNPPSKDNKMYNDALGLHVTTRRPRPKLCVEMNLITSTFKINNDDVDVICIDTDDDDDGDDGDDFLIPPFSTRKVQTSLLKSVISPTTGRATKTKRMSIVDLCTP